MSDWIVFPIALGGLLYLGAAAAVWPYGRPRFPVFLLVLCLFFPPLLLPLLVYACLVPPPPVVVVVPQARVVPLERVGTRV